MIDIIKVELFRLKKSAILWVMLALTVASPLLSVIIALSAAGAAGDISGMNYWDILRQTGLTNTLLNSISQISSDAAMWALIASAVVLSKEFVDGTMRNVMLANKSRSQLYFGYLITALIVSTTYLIAYFVVTLLIAAPVFGFGGISAGKIVTAILCSFAMGLIAMIFVSTCVCLFIFAVRKQWAAILFPLLICLLVPAIFTGIVEAVIALKALGGIYIDTTTLRWIPFTNMQTAYNPANIDGVTVGMNILYMGICIAIFTACGYFTFKKADLK